MSRTKHSIFLTLLLLSSFIIAKNLSKKSSLKSDKSKDFDLDVQTNDLFDPDCAEVSLKNNILIVTCKDQSREVNLDQKLTNNDGKLQMRNNGNYSKTCSDCSLVTEVTLDIKYHKFSCVCKDGKQNPKNTTIYVDPLLKRIINMD